MQKSLTLGLAALAVSVSSCGKQLDDPAFAREVAAEVKRDCLAARSDAPNEAFAAHLTKLCDCTEARIAATPMSRSDGQQTRYEKLQSATAACINELGGAPGEKAQ